jgi:hypothetical protein
MEGLTIRKKATPRAKSSSLSVSEAIFSGVLILLFIVLIPLLLLTLFLSFIWHKVFPETTAPAAPRPVVMHELINDFFPLRYHYVMGEEISEGATNYFDDEPLTLYQPATVTDFFQGYFSNFKIEYPTGIFVQKVNFDATLTEVTSMPLCFFNYATGRQKSL